MSHATISDSPKEDILANSGERVIKLSLSHLARNNHKLISVIQKMAIKNTEIAILGSIIINYIVLSSIERNVPLPPNFCKRTF